MDATSPSRDCSQRYHGSRRCFALRGRLVTAAPVAGSRTGLPQHGWSPMKVRFVFSAVTVLGTTPAVRAQQPPPVHQVGAIVAKTTEPLVQILGIHPLSNGRVVVNDIGGRGGSGRVLLFDSTLTTYTVLLDSSGVASRKY